MNNRGGRPRVEDVTASYFSFFTLEKRSFTYIDNCTNWCVSAVVSIADYATRFIQYVREGKLWPDTGNGDDEVNAVVHILPVVAGNSLLGLSLLSTILAAAALVPDMTEDQFLNLTDTMIRLDVGVHVSISRLSSGSARTTTMPSYLG